MASVDPPKTSGLELVDGLRSLRRPTIADYCLASGAYISNASILSKSQAKSAQLRLSEALSLITLLDLRDAGIPIKDAVAGERTVGGALREVKADVSETTEIDGLKLAIEIKPVHLAVGRAIWNRFGDIRTFAVNIHIKFPFAVVGGIMTVPKAERKVSGKDEEWKDTTHLVQRANLRFQRAGDRQSDSGPPHLLEGIAVVVFDHETGEIDTGIPPAGSGLRWEEFIGRLVESYDARFGDIS